MKACHVTHNEQMNEILQVATELRKRQTLKNHPIRHDRLKEITDDYGTEMNRICITIKCQNY